jgi:hypothetical protein
MSEQASIVFKWRLQGPSSLFHILIVEDDVAERMYLPVIYHVKAIPVQ